MAISALTRPVDERLLQCVPLVGLGLAGVGRDLEAPVAEVAGDLLGGGHGQAVDDARARLLGEVVGQPGQPLLRRLQVHDAQAQRLTVEGAALHEHRGVVRALGVHAQLLGDVVGDAGVGGRRRGQHRDPRRQLGQQRAQAAVVGAEVVAPVGDAVGLVDHQQAARRGQARQHLVAEAGVVEPLGAHQQHVDLAGTDLVLDRLPLVDVGRVDGHRADAGALGRGDLVAHQREQRADDDRRAGALLAQQLGGHEVDRRLAPPGALHDQRATVVDRERLDGRPLVLAQHGVTLPVPGADEGPQVSLGGLAGRAAYVVGDGCGGSGAGHGPCLPTGTDGPPGGCVVQ